MLPNSALSGSNPTVINKKPTDVGLLLMAEREGFEPSIGDKSYTPLAGARLQPLGHLSKENVLYCI